MIVFKTFLKVVKAYRIPILLYTCILVAFGCHELISFITR